MTVTYEYEVSTNTWGNFSTITNNAITASGSNDGSVLVVVSDANKNNFCLQKQYKVRVTYTSVQSLQSTKTASDEFTVTIKAYSNSQITLNSSSKETYTFNIPESSAPEVINPFLKGTITHAGCPVNCILEKHDGSNWGTLASTAELAFVTSGTGVCGLTVGFTLSSTFWTGTAPNLNQQRTTYPLRIGVQYSHLLAATPGVYAVYDDFDLVMQHHCYGDTFTLSTAKTGISQTIYATVQGDGSFGKTNVPATIVTQSDSTCSAYKQHSLEINDGTNWIDYNSQTNAIKSANYPYVQNYNAATAVFDIMFTSDIGPAWGGKQVNMRIKTTDPWSG